MRVARASARFQIRAQYNQRMKEIAFTRNPSFID
jgi:hypothetical protein